MSTTGVSPVTVMVSCRLLTRKSALMVMVPVPVIFLAHDDGESGERERYAVHARRQGTLRGQLARRG
jgi:hypothetical protein